MKKLNILITALGGDIGANIVNILSQQKNIEFNIIGMDIREKVFNIDKINKFYMVNRTDSPDYANQILKIIKENFIEIVVPVSEREILWFNENKSIFENLNIKIAINNKNIIDSFLNKLETSKVLNSISVKTPKTYLFSSYDNKLNFPIIVKGNYSIKTKDIYVIKNENQLNYLNISIKNNDDYIVQEYIGTINDEYTTTVYRSNNKLEVISFKRELTGGMTSFATISNEEILNDYARKIAKSFNLKGSINIQSRKVGQEFYIFEINPRFSSTVYIRDYFGFQDVLWWIEDILKLTILDTNQVNIDDSGSAILGYKYKFFKGEINE